MKQRDIDCLLYRSIQMRIGSIQATNAAGSGHITSSLSAADIISVLFFYIMRYDPKDPNNPENDRFVLSKGHAAPLLYAAWWQAGVIRKETLQTLRQFNSILEGHPSPRFDRVEAATGSLGCGLSIGLGIALAAMKQGRSYRSFVLLGDGECAEGSVWEAAEIAAYYHVKNLIAVVDINRLGQAGETMFGHDIAAYEKKFQAFGWKTFSVDGHNISDLVDIFDQATKKSDRPVVVLARTYKGFGVSGVENKNGFHGKVLEQKKAQQVLEGLKKQAKNYQSDIYVVCNPQKPPLSSKSKPNSFLKLSLPKSFSRNYATRQAYGDALVALGKECKLILCLDGEVKNSLFIEQFEKECPDQFIECFIAEQNMVGMAIGLASRGYIPFVSTFGAFFARAFDQIRMAAISRSPLRLVGSHAGVSIGADGPSQMALEDIACMRTLPDSIILCPCDVVSTYRLVECAAQYQKGISYLRMTREPTKTIYDRDKTFSIGGSALVYKTYKPQATLVATGITVHECLEAAIMLEQENIAVLVIDAYSIKPLDVKTIRISAEQSGIIITVEDHYQAGGLGEAVAAAFSDDMIRVVRCAVPSLAGSGTAQELRSWAGIDANNIAKVVKCCIL